MCVAHTCAWVQRASPETLALISRCFTNLAPRDLVDHHTHIVGTGDSGSGCYLNSRIFSLKNNPVQYFKMRAFMSGCGLTDFLDADVSMVSRLTTLIEGVNLANVPTQHPRHFILAFDEVYDDKGEKEVTKSTFHVPNDYVSEPEEQGKRGASSVAKERRRGASDRRINGRHAARRIASSGARRSGARSEQTARSGAFCARREQTARSGTRRSPRRFAEPPFQNIPRPAQGTTYIYVATPTYISPTYMYRALAALFSHFIRAPSFIHVHGSHTSTAGSPAGTRTTGPLHALRVHPSVQEGRTFRAQTVSQGWREVGEVAAEQVSTGHTRV